MYFVVECSTMSAPRRQRLLQCRRGKGVVHQHFRASVRRRVWAIAAMSAIDSSGLVGVSTQISRVCGVIAARTASTIGQRDRGVLHTPLGEDLVDQPERAAVGVVGDHHVITGTQQRAQRAVAGRHAGAECATEAALLDGGQRAFQRGPGRVAGAGVLESAAQTADAVLSKGAAGVDRGVDRAGRRVGPVAGVDGLGGQTGFCEVLRGRSSSISLVIAVRQARVVDRQQMGQLPHEHAGSGDAE